MSLTHSYLGAVDTAKIIDKEGRVVTDHKTIEKRTPYGIVSFDVKVVMKVELSNGRLVICDSSPSLQEGTIPVGEPWVTP